MACEGIFLWLGDIYHGNTEELRACCMQHIISCIELYRINVKTFGKRKKNQCDRQPVEIYDFG